MNHIIQAVYDQFASKRFPVPSESQILELEQSIHASIPTDYRTFIAEYNGGYFRNPQIAGSDKSGPKETLEILFGIGAPHWEGELGRPGTLALFEENDPPQLVPIGETGTGGLIVLVTSPDDSGVILLKRAFGDFATWPTGSMSFLNCLTTPNRKRVDIADFR